MCLLQTVLERPHYGFVDKTGGFTRPTHHQIWKEFSFRINPFRDRRNWLVSLSWIAAFSFVPFFLLFFLKFFSWKLLGIGLIYSMVLMGTMAPFICIASAPTGLSVSKINSGSGSHEIW